MHKMGFITRFGTEPPSVEDYVDIWRYAILELHARYDDRQLPTRGKNATILKGQSVNPRSPEK